MAKDLELNRTFDTSSSVYDKMRPNYVAELYKKIFDYISITPDSCVVEVGSGSGQATRPILDTGCKLTAVEYGEHLSELLREKFGKYKNFSVITGKFEDISFADSSCDLVFSATAFHWIPEDIGYSKVFSMLRSGGVFARFANRPSISRNPSAITQKIERLYDEYYYSYYKKERGTKQAFTEEQAEKIATIPEKYGFTDLQYHLFGRERVFSADEYVQLLSTYSDHIAMKKAVREEFFSKIAEAINYHGGTITIYDTLDLELARKP
ncbi:class I SAM-dependent methyltransferase [Ruminococcus flavefaciens]|uniref:Methyltransferase domain-containing protein n=1 Tax=Ruminococcus flavefaciens TaxID=1265 RepID=A0A1M7LYN3_RUMFL|nr:class I SAM-dependent methyltransferase [Ruminococcus flavefaciens]SHM83449.1 Methyltransferase domain-containing protein [Ruminococcus flavefaciens]